MGIAKLLRVGAGKDLTRAVDEAVRVVRKGGLIVYPTETLYGIGADPWNEEALARIGQVKRRPDGKPILLVASSFDAAGTFVHGVSPAAVKLMERFWPGPVTLVFTARDTVSSLLTQGTGRIGVRVSSHPLTRRIAEGLGGPLTSTSANVSGEPPPTDVAGIMGALGNGIDLYLDAGVLAPSSPSTVVDVSTDDPLLLREGVVTYDTLLEIIPSMRTTKHE